MKTRILLALVLAALVVPVVAQETPAQPTTPQAQQAPTTAPQTTTDKSQMATGKDPLTYQQHEGFWGKINPFARKKYVQRQLTPVQDRVNELDQLTASNTNMIKDVDSRASEGIRQASAKASEADSHAVEATNRAQQANETATQASQRLSTVQNAVERVDQYAPATQVELRFAAGQLILSKKAKEALSDLAGTLKDQKGYILEVQGFSSGRGQEAIHNSQLMADAVVRYLVLNHDVPVYRIYELGMGNAPAPVAATEEGKAVKRTRGGRVEVSLLKNSISELNSASAMPSNGMGGVSGATEQPAASSTSNPASNATQPATNQNAPVPPTPPATESKPPAKPPIR